MNHSVDVFFGLLVLYNIAICSNLHLKDLTVPSDKRIWNVEKEDKHFYGKVNSTLINPL